MRTLATSTALIAILTTSAALAQGLAPPSATVGQSGQAYTEIQATGPMPSPPFQAVLSPVAASVAPHAGAAPMVRPGGGAGQTTGRRGGPGAMGGPGDGMKGQPHDGMKGHGQGKGDWRDHAQGNNGHFPYGHRPWRHMSQYPNNGSYNNQFGYSPYGGYNFDPYGGYGGYYSPNYGYNSYPFYGYNYYPYYGYNFYPNWYGYNYWNPGYYYNPGYGY
jgi:hypothetical protein